MPTRPWVFLLRIDKPSHLSGFSGYYLKFHLQTTSFPSLLILCSISVKLPHPTPPPSHLIFPWWKVYITMMYVFVLVQCPILDKMHIFPCIITAWFMGSLFRSHKDGVSHKTNFQHSGLEKSLEMENQGSNTTCKVTFCFNGLKLCFHFCWS